MTFMGRLLEGCLCSKKKTTTKKTMPISTLPKSIWTNQEVLEVNYHLWRKANSEFQEKILLLLTVKHGGGNVKVCG